MNFLFEKGPPSLHPDYSFFSYHIIMSQILLRALRPTPSGIAFISAAVLVFRNHLQRASYAKLCVLFVLFLNRGNLPFRWHLKLFSIGLRARLRYDKGRLGILKASESQQRLRLQGGELGLMGIGTSVFDILTVRKTRVSFAESDYNLSAAKDTAKSIRHLTSP